MLIGGVFGGMVGGFKVIVIVILFLLFKVELSG